MSDDIKHFYPEGSGNANKVEAEKDDIPEKTRATLKEYLRDLTKKNVYSIEAKIEIDPKTKERKSLDEEISIESNSEDQVSEIKPDTNENQFISLSGDSTEAQNLRSYSDSGKFTDLEDKSSTLKTFFDKNKRGQGHNLLRDIKGSRQYGNGALTEPTGRDKKEIFNIPAEAPEVQKRISSILINNNRFSPSSQSPYVREGSFSKPDAAYGSIQPELGTYTRNTPLGDLAIADLKKVAASLMLKQTGHAGGDSDPDSENFITVAPGSFIDTRVPIGDTYAGNAHKGSNRRNRPLVDIGLEDEDQESFAESQNPFDGNSTYITINDGKSFGATNSYLEPFTGNPLAAITFVCQGLVTVFALGFVIGIFLDQLFKEFSDDRAQGKDPGSLPMGQYTDAPSATLVNMGVPYLRFPVFTCIAYGLAAFFRIDPPDDDIGNFAELALWFASEALDIFKFVTRINESKGYYVSIIRNIMRDNNKIISTLSDPMLIMGAIGSALLSGGDAKSVLASLVSLFSGISSFRFFMACAVVGEKSKLNEIRDFAGIGSRLLENVEDAGPTRVAKSKVNPTANALAWRHRSAPAMMLLPTALINAKGIVNNHADVMTAAAATVGDYEGTERHRRQITFNSNGRFTSDEVLKFENELETEYMPFYFHDLRTNEVINFHAFIADMKDSFSVSYSDTSAYGRIDPVKIYQRTQRSISVSFWMVSTSQEDFDSMWFSINKLVQMIYPQWSEGRKLSSGGKNFTMPFSQIPTASPMIRLRIGDFIRSNGSKFNLMKLFGLQEAEEESVFYAQSPKHDDATVNKKVDDAREVLIGSIDVISEQDVFKKGSQAILKRSTTHPYVTNDAPAGGGALGAIASFFGPPSLPYHTWTRTDSLVKITAAESRPGAPKIDESLGEEFVTKKPYQYRVEFVDPKDPANPHKDAVEMVVLASDLKVVTTETDLVDNPDPDLTLDSHEFFDKHNSIIEAYQSTRGRGLPGFITSLDFDYADSTYETGEITRRAPKMVKVSLAFAPIHDIAPGMDSKGGMRAPLYPVGDISAHAAGDELANTARFGVKPNKVQENFSKQNAKLTKKVD